MNLILQDDLSPALTLLKEGLGTQSVLCHPCGDGLRVICAPQRGFALSIRLQGVSSSLPQEAIWEELSLGDSQLIVKSQGNSYCLRYHRAQCEIRFLDYVNAPLSYDPHRYLRERIADILWALAQKNRLLPHLLTESERRFLPLCDLALFGNAPLSSSGKKLLSPWGIRRLPLKEDRAALALFSSLQKLAPPTFKQEQESVNRTVSSCFGDAVFPIKPRKRLFSLGLRTVFCRKKRLFCHLRALPWEDRVVLECALTANPKLSFPVEAALESRKLQQFWLFSLPAKDFNETTLRRFQKEAQCLTFREFSPLQRPTSLRVFPVFLLSSLLWAALSYGLIGAIGSLFPALLPLLPFSPLPSLGYGLLRGCLYAASEKL